MNYQSAHPSSSRVERLQNYVAEMFPLRVRVPINLLNFAVIYFGLQAVNGLAPLQVTQSSLIGALTVQLLWFFIRVYDELKDAESDMELARKGDARFVNRPLVTGRVKLSDIAALRWWLTAVVIALNVLPASLILAAGLAIALGYLTLTFKWLFVPSIKEHTILVFLTHIPNVLVIEIYTAFVFFSEFHGNWRDPGGIALIFGLWATIAAFEFAYKIRRPQDETDLKTYSKVLGYQVATWICIALLLSSGAMVHFALSCLGHGYFGLAAFGCAVVATLPCLRFLVQPSSLTVPLTRYVGLYWYGSSLIVLIAIFSSRGVSLGL